MALTEEQLNYLENKLPDIFEEASLNGNSESICDFTIALITGILRGKDREYNSPIYFIEVLASYNGVPIPFITTDTSLDLSNTREIEKFLLTLPHDELIEKVTQLLNDSDLEDDTVGNLFGIYAFRSKE